MMLHIRDSEADRLARELAQLLRVPITEAVKIACREARARNRKAPSLWERTADLRKRIDTFPKTSQVVDKKFFDDLSD